MRKRILIALSLMLVMAFTIFGISSADLPGSGWHFGATFQNIGGAPANVVVTAYDANSSATYPYTISPAIPSFGTSVVQPGNIPGLPSDFEGSIVASADQPLAALVHVTNRPITSLGLGVTGGKASGLYAGIDGTVAATSVSFPLVKHNVFGKTTTLYLQNAGASAATISVAYKVNGVTYNYTSPSVGPGQMVAVDPGLASVPAANTSVGSAVATSSQPIAGVFLEHQHAISVATVIQASTGFTPGELDQVAYCPQYKYNFFGVYTGLSVQNAHSSAQNITANFIDSNGNETPDTFTNVPAGASVTFLYYNDPGAPISGGNTNGLYSVRVEGALGNIAAVMNEGPIPQPADPKTTVTKCVAESQATTTVAYPQFKEGLFGRQTALLVQNTGASTANVTAQFTNSNGTYTTNSFAINANAGFLLICASSQANISWSGSSLGTSTLSGVRLTSNQPIIAMANEASWNSTNPCQRNNTSSAFDNASDLGVNLP